jgi:hypothetical protein
MSDIDVKAPHHLAVNPGLNTPDDEDYNVIQRAQELIRALDAKSNQQMEQISAEEKASEPEDFSL